MKCPTCQHGNRGRAIFCLKYGEKLEIKCPQYGNSLPPEALFCDKCGHDLRKPVEAKPVDYTQSQSYTIRYLKDKILTTQSSIEGERKFATVFFADVPFWHY
jgi:hypothetical protein